MNSDEWMIELSRIVQFINIWITVHVELGLFILSFYGYKILEADHDSIRNVESERMRLKWL